MKKLLLIGLIIGSIGSFAPLHAQHTLYTSFYPTELGVGLRYDLKCNDRNGFYVASSYGNYKFHGGFIDDHVRIAVGGISYTKYSFLTMGIAFGSYGKKSLPTDFDMTALQRFTLEMGVGTKLDRISVAASMDMPKWEAGIHVGVNF